MGRTGRLFAWIGFAVGLYAVTLQGSLTIPERLAKGDTVTGALTFYFSFMTILSNSVLALVHLAVASEAPALARLRGPAVRTAMAALMLFVMVYFHFALAPTLALTGWWRVASHLLHYATPSLYLISWLLFAPHGQTRLAQVPAMVAWPLAYVLYAIGRGAMVGEYPYPVLNAATLGYGRVAIGVVVLLLIFALLCAGLILLDRWLGRFGPPVAEGARQA
ncbi:hypothetical protein ACFB49_20910 [Sphingomonas sp. DBB INV C78]|uniref:Pr6Pr family membrane protein n=1 Tax=Sphingomonas sp. DBB INV C78 TaxID=3349434 RepID=UPI0036D25790